MSREDITLLKESLGKEELLRTLDDGEYAKTGFNYRSQATHDAIPAIAQIYLDRGYFLEMLTCLDRLADDEIFRLVYAFNRFDRCERHALDIDLKPTQAVATISQIHRSANWFEREVCEMFGVHFDGHQNLKRLLLPEDTDFHPLLKDFGRIEDAP
jgi:NADH-quinone oxidoreductase subunit C